ncbi:MAG: VCBS repeat-containing protein [Gemmataceae bacterium]
MRRLLLPAALFGLAASGLAADKPAPAITWQKTVLDSTFRSEGVAVADVNKDGKTDVLVGEFWYEAPDWKRHEMQPPGNYGTGEKGYSKVFACWAEDLNADGYPDLIVIDFPGAPCYWLENPKGGSGHWKKHVIWHSACNETPIYVDLFGTGKRALVMGFQPKGKPANGNDGQMAYFTPNPADPTAEWVMHPISAPSEPGKPVPGTFMFAHGLGAGDVNGDGRVDVVTSGAATGGQAGWWEQPAKPDGKTPWAFHPFQFGDAVADMFVVDIDADGKNDILCTSAHKFGVWMLKQRADKKTAHPVFDKVELFGRLASETHAAHFVDIDGDGLKDLVTGKRWWSHGRSEPGSAWEARVYYLKAVKERDGYINFVPHVIDPDSGVGTQFVVADINGDGLPDVVTSNKKGVHVIVQQRK